MSGSRMYLLRGAGARLHRALIDYFLAAHAAAGYEELYLPAMVREEAMFASGQLPKFRDTLYHDAEEDYWFVPTAEVPITNLHRDEVLDGARLPLRYAAHTPCFRREKASAGRDVRGMKRVHQFEKVEIYQFTAPETSAAALQEMIGQAEALLRGLGLTYRVVQLCSADLGFSAAVTYDLEVWAPGAGEWMEVSSLSNCTDFQARRANVRYRPAPGERPRPVHTLNGSGLPAGRVLAALLEECQQEDGGVVVPEALQSRLGQARIVPPG
jgi:seryl-tRNA synthetase